MVADVHWPDAWKVALHGSWFCELVQQGGMLINCRQDHAWIMLQNGLLQIYVACHVYLVQSASKRLDIRQ